MWVWSTLAPKSQKRRDYTVYTAKECMMDDHDQERLERLRHQLEETASLIALERERNELSVEILEAILLRLATLERRVEMLGREDE
jgi:hypothetical protein